MITFVKGGEDAGNNRLRASVHADLYRGVGGAFAVGDSLEGLQAARPGGNDTLIGRVIAVWTGGTPTGDADVNERRIERAKRGGIAAEGSGAILLLCRDEDVRASRQRCEFRTGSRRCEVERHAALAAQPHGRIGQRAERIAARGFDLDDLGAEIAEHHSRDATHRANAQVEDTDAVEGSLGHEGCLRVARQCDMREACLPGASGVERGVPRVSGDGPVCGRPLAYARGTDLRRWVCFSVCRP